MGAGVFVCVTWLTILCCANRSDASFADFFNNIGHAFTVAWTSLIENIKKPVRIQRLGSSRRQVYNNTRTIQLNLTTVNAPPKSTPARTTTTTEEITIIPSTTFSSERQTDGITSQGSSTIPSVTLPLLSTPSFKSLVQWRSLQKPQFADDSVENLTSLNDTVIIEAVTQTQDAPLDN